ncbi:hypothetical protein HMPREF0491_01654 [Lachnospiraceae oral taxon 107 str. F0167]|jgi:hypothetical protein|nr:hypothetical protein HMPREF0491_01654 [Lachnospiraceae oral taxon 107 str. F0167]
MNKNTTYIPIEMAYRAREIYGRQRALKDLLLSLPFHDEKCHLKEKIEGEIEDVAFDIEDWWASISKITSKTFSENAEIFFDSATIVD